MTSATKIQTSAMPDGTYDVVYTYPLKGKEATVKGVMYKSVDGAWRFKSFRGAIQLKLGDFDWSSAKGVLRMKLDELFKVNVEPMNDCTILCDCHISGKPCLMKQTSKTEEFDYSRANAGMLKELPKTGKERFNQAVEQVMNDLSLPIPDGVTIVASKDKTCEEIHQHLSQNPPLPEVMGKALVVHILRNPAGWNEEYVRMACNTAADLIEGMK